MMLKSKPPVCAAVQICYVRFGSKTDIRISSMKENSVD
jgi:hypothetical protein